MLLFCYLIFFPKIITAKWNIASSLSPTLEAINDSYVYVDYSKAFTVDFSEIKYAELMSSDKFLKSKAARDVNQIEIKGKTIFQPLDENRKIVAKMKICEKYQSYPGHEGPYIRLYRNNNKTKKDSADARIFHDPLKIIGDVYRNQMCYPIHNTTIFFEKNQSDISKFCDPQIKIISSAEHLNTEIEISLKGRLLKFKLEPCNKTMDVEEEKNEMKEEKEERKMYWMLQLVYLF